MTDEEVNKIIAEFMCLDIREVNGNQLYVWEHNDMASALYTESLDALVPVWEKLSEDNPSCDTIKIDLVKGNESASFVFWNRSFFHDGEIKYYSEGKTTQQAAAHATAKAILELKND